MNKDKKEDKKKKGLTTKLSKQFNSTPGDYGDVSDVKNSKMSNLDDGVTVFGVKLDNLMKRPDQDGEMIPKIVRWAIQNLWFSSLRYDKGIKTHGIFRESGNASRMQELKEVFNKEETVMEQHLRSHLISNPFDIVHPHDVACILKQYLRELPEPLMRFENYSPIVEVVRSINFGNEQETIVILKIIKECISSTLPLLHSRLLFAILRFLQKTTALAQYNSMLNSNLGIVFGQTLFRAPELSPQMLQDAQYLNKAVALMITHTEQLFDLSKRPDLIKLERLLFHTNCLYNDVTPEKIDPNEPMTECANSIHETEQETETVSPKLSIQLNTAAETSTAETENDQTGDLVLQPDLDEYATEEELEPEKTPRGEEGQEKFVAPTTTITASSNTPAVTVDTIKLPDANVHRNAVPRKSHQNLATLFAQQQTTAQKKVPPPLPSRASREKLEVVTVALEPDLSSFIKINKEFEDIPISKDPIEECNNIRMILAGRYNVMDIDPRLQRINIMLEKSISKQSLLEGQLKEALDTVEKIKREMREKEDQFESDKVQLFDFIEKQQAIIDRNKNHTEDMKQRIRDILEESLDEE